MCVSSMSRISTMTVEEEELSGAQVLQPATRISSLSSFSRVRFNSISEFRPSQMHKSRSAGVLGVFSHDTISRQELETLVDGKRKEPTKVTKAQIKEYAQKYKNFQSDEKKDSLPWYK